jgi:hypothetical protein
MWKWLRSWFAWRFSLGRLVVATVFLGGIVGLNTQDISLPVDYQVHRSGDRIEEGHTAHTFCGWPLPFNCLNSSELGRIAATQGTLAITTFDPTDFDWLPWTHQAYRLLDLCAESGLFVDCAILDVLLALAMLSLSLSLQIPRRKTLAPPPPARAGG